MSGSLPDPRAHQVLASVSRVAVLEMLRASSRPLGVQDLADRMGLHPNTIRAHLERLIEYGHVRRLRDTDRRPGRPRGLYAAVPDPDRDPDPTPQGYRLLADVLAGYLRTVDDGPAAAVAAGERAGEQLIQRGGNGAPTIERVLRMLDDIGFQPELVADRSAIRLHHCPFHDLARDQPDIVCNVHLGLLRGALRALGAPAEATRLIPFVTPRLCVVELGPPPARPDRA